MADDFYKILGVRWNASTDQIGKAYRSLVRKYHPDINQKPGADEKFQEIQKAFEVLSNPDKRAEFDRSRKKAAPRLSKGFYNPSKLRYTRIPGGLLEDKYKLIHVNVICVVLMIVVSSGVSLMVLNNENASPPATPEDLGISEVNGRLPQDYLNVVARWKEAKENAIITSTEFVIAPFLAVILCINICYFGIHRK